MTGLFRPRQSFLMNNAWQTQARNALHYNTSQQGSVVPLIYGTHRQQANLIDLNNYRGPQGKKGKSGSLPVAGTSQSGKGGGGKGKGSKKNAHYTVDVDVAVCQGPVTFNASNNVYASSGIEPFSATGLNFYSGSDGQTPDPHFNIVGYSGTCHVTGTPIDLGHSPVLPDMGFEITGFLTNVNTGSQSSDANPADVIVDFLTNSRYGVGFPSSCVGPLIHGSIANPYGDYCQASYLLISVVLDGHQKAIEWLDGICKLTNSALVWSGKLLRVIPYGDVALNSNGVTWAPNLTVRYELTDNHFLPWRLHPEGGEPTPGEDDPVIVERNSPADADDWASIEYLDRANFYNSTLITSFDQGAIDTYGLRIGDSVAGKAFANPFAAQISLQLQLQRRLYIRNKSIKFQVGWQFALLEPMDIVSITGRSGDNYLDEYPVRITSIEENDNGDLSITAEDSTLQGGVAAPISSNVQPGAIHMINDDLVWPLGLYTDPVTGAVLIDPGSGIYGWNVSGPPGNTLAGVGSPSGTFATWIRIPDSQKPPKPPPGAVSGIVADWLNPAGDGTNNSYAGLLQTRSYLDLHHRPLNRLTIGINWDESVFVYFGGMHYQDPPVQVFASLPGTFRFDGVWHHLLFVWDCPLIRVWLDGGHLANAFIVNSPGWNPLIIPGNIEWQWEWYLQFYSIGGILGYANSINGCVQDGWFTVPQIIDDPTQFRHPWGSPVNLGFRGEKIMGYPPRAYFHYYPQEWPVTHYTDLTFTAGQVDLVGPDWYSINRAGYFPDYNAGFPGEPWNSIYGDPTYPNMHFEADSPAACVTSPYQR